jgi:hypothetical protein
MYVCMCIFRPGGREARKVPYWGTGRGENTRSWTRISISHLEDLEDVSSGQEMEVPQSLFVCFIRGIMKSTLSAHFDALPVCFIHILL